MSGEVDTSYPAKYETEVVLRTGKRVRLRPIRSDDTGRWLQFINNLSDRTKYLRFHYMPEGFAEEDAARYCAVDYINTFAVVAELIHGREKEIIAIGRFYRLPDEHSAEVSFVIADAHQEAGIGTRLLEWLANVARDNGINRFVAEVLAENTLMLTVFNDYGFHITSQREADIYSITFPIARTKRVEKKEEERERLSTITSLKYLLYPRSIAIVGASRKQGSIGQLIVEQIVHNNFSGVIYPINPNADSVMSVRTYPKIADVPGEVDMAIIAVPAHLVAGVADECGQKGVRAIVVISDGFRERGPEGAARERELREITLGHGMRLVGPNCMGVINTDKKINLNGTFSRIYPPQGEIAFLSQSGAMGLVILDYARGVNLGISSFVSVGNRADISANDLLQYWEQDPATKVILLYIESFGNPHKFSRIARRVTRKKPILAVKSGSTPAGTRAASSHTGAMATPEIVSEALFNQAGIIRIDSVEELFDTAMLLANQPIPAGKNVVIITNGGGPGIMAADACAQHGLVLSEFSEEAKNKLKEVIGRDVGINNPLDLTAAAPAKEFQDILRVCAAEDNIDAVLTMFIPAAATGPEEMEQAVKKASTAFKRNRKTFLACFIGQRGVKRRLGTVPSYLFPEDAVRSLARAVEYGEILKRPVGKVPEFRGIKAVRARRIVLEAMSRNVRRPFWLSAVEISEILRCYGIRAASTEAASTPEEAARKAAQLGFPVAVKLDSATIVHKTDVGGVKLNLKSGNEVKQSFREIRSKLIELGRADEMQGVTVQKIIEGGVEAIVGVTQDPGFGPLIMFGLGGVYAELFKDVALRLHPLTDLDAREQINSIKMVKLFEGFRGSQPSDKEALEELLLRVSTLVEDIPEIAELDLNPVKVMPEGQGYWVVDARVMVK